MGGKGNQGTQQQKTETEPWFPQAYFLSQHLYPQAAALKPQQAFAGTAVPEFAPYSQQAMEMQAQRAMAGSPLLPAAQEATLGTLRGDYLTGGPGFQRAFEAASRAITPQVQGAFERAGRFGGGLAQEAHTRALGDAFAGLYGQERGRQMTAAGMAPGLAQAQYQDIGQLARVGAMQEARDRERLQEEMQKHYFTEEAPYRRIAAMAPVLAGGWQPAKTTGYAQQPQSSPLAGAIGGALMGGFTPLGALGGGALGYLGSK